MKFKSNDKKSICDTKVDQPKPIESKPGLKSIFHLIISTEWLSFILNFQKICTLRSLLNELACLTVLNTVKRASSFDRDLRVNIIYPLQNAYD